MSPEQTQAVEVAAAADNAMMTGLTRIQEAAVAAGKPLLAQLKVMDAEKAEAMAKGELDTVEKQQATALKTMLAGEQLRQKKELADMENNANMVAKLSADHVRQTTEQWAENQARNYINLAANGTISDAALQAQQTAQIRQEATELTKGAIQSAAQSLAVAKRAQEAIENAPKDRMEKAKQFAEKSEAEQKLLNVQIEATESSVRRIARVADEANKVALRTLTEANAAEKLAKESLATSRGNAAKIEKLKIRAQAAATKAQKAKEELEKSKE